ncbi:MAG: hypothetical protein ACOZNI_02530 [Myxococcota bacterium]
MSLRVAPWWAEAVVALRTSPLADVAARHGVDPEEFLDALVAAGIGQGADAAPWWPEALRLRATTSIRALAKRFRTEPRRIRRGLARAGLRVQGEELDGRGPEALRGVRLGTRPDGEVARAAGVIPEAVQGERRRLRVPAFRPRPAVKLSDEEEAWARGDHAGRRDGEPARADAPRAPRRVPQPEAPAVVRRPGRLSLPILPPAPSVAAAPPPPEPKVEPPREPDPLPRPGHAREGRMRLVRGEPARGSPPSPPSVVRVAARGSEPGDALSPSVRPPEVRRVVLPEVLFAEGAREADATWHVHLPGEDAPLVVVAADLVRAVNAAATVLPWEVLQGVRVERVERRASHAVR